MTLEGAINLNETNDYIIYTMNSVTTGQYGVVVPKNIGGTLKMLVDLHMKSSFDGIASGVKTREQLVSEISDEYNKLKSKYSDGMLVMPMIDEAVFKSIVVNGDKQKMFDEVKKIGAITSELYKKLTDQGIDKQKIDQKIIIVEKIEEDSKFVAWLMEQMPNFVEGLSYNELNSVGVNTNPFVDSNSIFGPAVSSGSVEQASVTPSVENTVASNPVGGGIFDNVAPVASPAPAPVVEPVQPVTPVEPVIPNNLFGESAVNAQPQVNNDVFGTPVAAPVAPQQPPVVETPVATQPDNVFGPAVSAQPVVEQAPVQPQVQPVVQNTTPVVEGPKPVENTALESTMTFSTVVGEQQPNGEVSGENTDSGEGAPARSKSQGFVNLLILVVILVGVTIVSIEIGKYLYSVYGA